MIRDRIRQAGIRSHMPAEELILIGSLVRPCIDHGAWPAGGDHNHWQVRMPGLQHRRMQIGRRGA